MKTVKYLKTTQSHPKGAVVDLDETSAQYQQLLKGGFIEEYAKPEPAKETKVVAPKETKPAKPASKK